jgi:hypothetical protein
MEKPTIIRGIYMDLEPLKDICQQYIDFVDNDEEYHEDHDFKEYIFETAVQMLYGEKVWDWINNRQE